MTNEFLKMFLKNAVDKSIKEGGSTLIQELAEALSAEQIEKLVGLLNEVKKKKSTIIEAKVVR
jgi:predicted transcriptional regulator